MRRGISLLFIIIAIVGLQTFSVHAYEETYQPSHENGTGYELSINGHKIEFIYSSGAFGNLYADGEFIDRDVLWRFFSNGYYTYYTKNSNIYRLDLNTKDTVSILLENDTPFIEGVYGDKYLYYSSTKHSNVTQSLQDLIVYDIENRSEITYIEDVGSVEMSNEYIFVEPCSGDISPLDIRQYSLDGSNGKIIANDASTTMELIDNKLYYAAIEITRTEDAFLKEKVKAYNIDTGETLELTDAYARMVVTELTSSYAVFQDIATSEKYVEYYKPQNSISVILNGEEIKFDQPPVMMNDRVLVPIRAIFEPMGYTVNWDGYTSTATAQKGYDVITVQLNNSNITYTINGSSRIYTCDVPPQLISNRILVPVRAIAECAGSQVNWDDNNKLVNISSVSYDSNRMERYK